MFGGEILQLKYGHYQYGHAKFAHFIYYCIGIRNRHPLQAEMGIESTSALEQYTNCANFLWP